MKIMMKSLILVDNMELLNYQRENEYISEENYQKTLDYLRAITEEEYHEYQSRFILNFPGE